MEKQTKQKIPTGIIIILSLTGWSIFSNILYLKNAIYLAGPFLITGPIAIILKLIVIGIYILIFYGIVKRFAWAKKLVIVWFLFSIFLTVINLISFLKDKTMFDDYYQKTLSPEQLKIMTPAIITGTLFSTAVISWIIGIFVITYIYRKKNYFVK